MSQLDSSSDTIVAIATPLGEGGLGVVRLSGPASLPITDRIFIGSDSPLKDVASHTLHHGWIRKNKLALDEIVAALYKAPKSYTGEDVVELSCHGGPVLLQEILELCQSEGARLAKPGEFTERAFLNGKIDLVQAEAVADLIQARSVVARRAATDQLQGHLSERIQKIRQPLVDLLAHLEANLDFVEEDIPVVPRNEIQDELRRLQKETEELLSTSLKGRYVRQGVRVAIIGRPNVGKSSIFNALLAQDRAIVTDIPGTTRDTLEEQVQWEGYAVVLTDTAGLRPTSDPIEQLGTDRTRRSIEQADVVLFVGDATDPATLEDSELLNTIGTKDVVSVLNKCDMARGDLSRMNTIVRTGSDVLEISALTGQGLADLKKSVLKFVEKEGLVAENVPVLTNLRHIHQMELTKKALERAGGALGQNQTEEVIGLELRSALHELSLITGEDATENVRDAIFRRFCIGK